MLIALSLSIFSFPSVKAANANILYVNPALQGPFPAGTTVTYQVKVSQMDPFNAWDIMVKTDPSASALNPVSLSITPNLLTANYSLTLLELTNCVNGSGSGCNTAAGDGPGVVHSAVFPLGAPPSVASVSGVLFTITYMQGTGSSSAVTIFNDVIASAGVNVIHTTVSGAYGIVPPQDYTISISPSSQSLTAPPGGTAVSLVSIGSLGGFAGSVSLSTSVSPSGQGVTASLDQPAVTAPGSTNLNIVAFSNATAGQYAILVNAVATIGTSSVPHSAQFMLTVNPSIPDYELTINPNPLPAVLAGYNGSTTVTVTSINNFVGTVTLSATTSPTNIASGPVATLSSNSVTLSANQSQTVSMLVQTFPLTPVPAPSPSGLYAIILIGNSGSLTHSALGVVTVKPAVFFRQLSWTHHLLYTKDAGVQTFTARVQNNSTGTVIGQVVVLVRCGSFRAFARSDPAGTALPGGNVAQGIAGPIVTMTFTLTLPATTIGDECTVRGALFYGGSSDPATLTSVAIRRNTFTTNIVDPLIAVNGKTKSSGSASINFQFETTRTGKFFVKP